MSLPPALIFREEPQAGESVRMPLPIFYHSREVKELGTEAVKIGNSRIMGILFAPERCLSCGIIRDIMEIVKTGIQAEIAFLEAAGALHQLQGRRP